MYNFLNVSNLLESNYKQTKVVPRINIDESYFITALEHVEKINNMKTNANKKLYKSILESENSVDVNRSFVEISQAVNKSIDKAIEAFKDIDYKFSTAIKKIKEASKDLKDLFEDNKSVPSDNMDNEDYVELEIFDFASIIKNNPSNPFPTPLKFWNRMSSNKGSEETGTGLLKGSTSRYDDFKESNPHWESMFKFNLLNKQTHNTDNPEQFHEEVFKLFRGSTDPNLTRLYHEDVKDAFNRFNRPVDTYGLSDDIVRDLYSIKKDISDWILGLSSSEIVIDDNNTEWVDSDMSRVFIKGRLDKLEVMINTFLTVHGIRLDAIKDCLIQDEKILRETIKEFEDLEDAEDIEIELDDEDYDEEEEDDNE